MLPWENQHNSVGVALSAQTLVGSMLSAERGAYGRFLGLVSQGAHSQSFRPSPFSEFVSYVGPAQSAFHPEILIFLNAV